jgi:tetratricopeptide (TPR) repeat protein
MRKSIAIVAMLVIAAGGAVYALERGLSQGQSRQSKPQGANVNDSFWRQKLTEFQNEIKTTPDSAFWHSQAAVAYDNLGDLQGFETEIHLATKLDDANPIYHSMAYAVYKRRAMKPQRNEALKNALKTDPENPFGHFEMGYVYEEKGDWKSALDEYRTVQKLLQGPSSKQELSAKKEYVDPRGNPFSLGAISQDISDAIERTAAHVDKH